MAKRHVITLMNNGPGAGKTTLCRSLAAVFAAERPVRLIEADTPLGDSLSSNDHTQFLKVLRVPEAGSLAEVLDDFEEPLTVVDAPPFADDVNRMLFDRSDLVLVPVPVSSLELEGIRGVLDACLKQKKRALVVLSLVDPRATANLRQAREALTSFGVPLARNPFCRRAAYVEAAAAKVPITQFAPNSIALSEVRALANEVAILLR